MWIAYPKVTQVLQAKVCSCTKDASFSQLEPNNPYHKRTKLLMKTTYFIFQLIIKVVGINLGVQTDDSRVPINIGINSEKLFDNI